MSTKKYDTPAERQRAHRQRVKDRLAALMPPAPPPLRQPRKKTRPQRLEALMNELQTMADEYEEWKNTMPVNLAHGELADGLTDAVRQLHRAKDVLANINLPRGFGRSQIIAT